MLRKFLYRCGIDISRLAVSDFHYDRTEAPGILQGGIIGANCPRLLQNMFASENGFVEGFTLYLSDNPNAGINRLRFYVRGYTMGLHLEFLSASAPFSQAGAVCFNYLERAWGGNMATNPPTPPLNAG